MIGTSYEMMLYLLYDSDIVSQLRLTRDRVVLFRHELSRRNIPEKKLADTLTKLGCRCIRPSLTLPCMVKDKNGRLFDECTFVKMFLTRKLADRYGYNYDAILRVAEQEQSINRVLFKHLLKSRRAWIVLDKMVLDSVWSYEPIELTMTREKVIQVRSMLATSYLSLQKPQEMAHYKRKAPVLSPPDE